MFDKILVPVDGSETSNRGLAQAIKMAGTLGSDLYVVHIVNEFVFDYTGGSAQYVTDLMESMRGKGRTVLAAAVAEARKYGVQARAELLETFGGRASEVILRHATQIGAELIVMGTHGRRGLRRLALGSDAEGVVRNAGIPVLLVRGEAAEAIRPTAGVKLAAASAVAA
jgi:nucleotide-binding universal stress UspA family protein